MSELLETYDLNGTFLGTQARKEFYDETNKEFREKGTVSRKVKTVRVLLMNSLGRIYVQKRSDLKNDNPGLYDKTVGGHVVADNTYELTVIRECAEELGFPATVLSENEFEKAIRSVDLKVVGVFKKVDHIDSYNSQRILVDGKSFTQPYMTDVYIGYYDGAIRFADGESSGVETFSIEQLKIDIANNPQKFTEDLKSMIDTYSHLLVTLK